MVTGFSDQQQLPLALKRVTVPVFLPEPRSRLRQDLLLFCQNSLAAAGRFSRIRRFVLERGKTGIAA